MDAEDMKVPCQRHLEETMAPPRIEDCRHSCVNDGQQGDPLRCYSRVAMACVLRNARLI